MKHAIMSLLSAAFTMGFSSYAKSDGDFNTASNTYVLVHGAWQAPYVWDAVRTNLVNKGNQVIVVELPGHGSDTSPAYTLSIEAYRDKAIEAITKVDGKVILVGHSMGGMVITAVAEKIPSKISKLVYVGAFLPASGQSIGDLAMLDPDSKLGASLMESADHLTLDVKRENLAYLFINDGSPADKERVFTNYRPEPAIPFGNKLTLTTENFGSVEKVYIKTLQDIVISPGLQDRMIAAAGIKTVYTVNTSHSPFLAQPKTISNLLLAIGLDVTAQVSNKPESSNAVTRLTRYEVKPAFQMVFRKAISDYVLYSLDMESNILSEAYYEQDKPSVLWIIERWSNRSVLGKISQSVHFKSIDSLSRDGLTQAVETIYVKDLMPLSKLQWRNKAGREDKPLTIMLFVDSKAGTEEIFMEVYNTAMPEFRNEPGVINYQLSQFEDDNTRFVTYEKFRNEDAFQYHLNFPPIKPVIDYLNTSIKKQPFQSGLHKLVAFAPFE